MTAAVDLPTSTVAAAPLTYCYEQLSDEVLGRRPCIASMAHTVVLRQGVAAWLRLAGSNHETARRKQSQAERAPAPAPSCSDLLIVLTNLVFQAHGEGSAND